LIRQREYPENMFREGTKDMKSSLCFTRTMSKKAEVYTMQVLEVDGKQVQLDDDGYLVNYTDWNEKVACAMADREGVSSTCPLTEEKMEIIRFMREYYEKFEAFPIPRGVCLRVHQDKNCSYEEFPDPAVAWKIAGLPQPSRRVIAQVKGLGGVS